MITSLFGDLGDARPRRQEAGDAASTGFAATSILESVATELNPSGLIVDRRSRDLMVIGNPAQAIRDHFAATRADLDTATQQIALLDPAGVWASAVVKALSDAGGQPIERLHLREHATLRTLATIERTALVRRQEDTLKIYHADVRAPGRENAEIPVALMERSQMTAVIVGPLQPHAIDAVLDTLREATLLPTWRCPHLLFMLPPNAVWIANKIGAIAWPGTLQLHVTAEPLTSASAVWNAMLGVWNRIKADPAWHAETPAASEAAGREPALPVRLGHQTPEPARIRQALAELQPLDGVLGCALVESGTGLVVASGPRGTSAVDIELTASTSAQMLRAQRAAAGGMGLSDQVEEIVTTAGPRQQVVRVLSRSPQLFLVVLLDRQRANLSLLRFRLMEIDKGLV